VVSAAISETQARSLAFRVGALAVKAGEVGVSVLSMVVTGLPFLVEMELRWC